jgi:hypothetical protein
MADMKDNEREEKNDNTNNLFIKESDDSDESTKNKDNDRFSSTDSDDESTESYNHKIIRKKKNINKSKSIITGITATNGIKIIDDISMIKKKVDCDLIETTKESSENPPNDPDTKNKSNMIENMLQPNNVNGWDEDANTTVRNWYHTFKQQSFIYQWILDYNNLMSERLAVASIITSSTLGIFTGFKLWIPDDVFQTISNIFLILSNFVVAIIIAMSRKYGDDKRTDSIRNYVNEIDAFLGEISAQVLKSPIYRMNADDFFKENNDKYTKLIISAPNMSIEEIEKAKHQYKIYLQKLELPI